MTQDYGSLPRCPKAACIYSGNVKLLGNGHLVDTSVPSKNAAGTAAEHSGVTGSLRTYWMPCVRCVYGGGGIKNTVGKCVAGDLFQDDRSEDSEKSSLIK